MDFSHPRTNKLTFTTWLDVYRSFEQSSIVRSREAPIIYFLVHTHVCVCVCVTRSTLVISSRIDQSNFQWLGSFEPQLGLETRLLVFDTDNPISQIRQRLPWRSVKNLRLGKHFYYANDFQFVLPFWHSCLTLSLFN